MEHTGTVFRCFRTATGGVVIEDPDSLSRPQGTVVVFRGECFYVNPCEDDKARPEAEGEAGSLVEAGCAVPRPEG